MSNEPKDRLDGPRIAAYAAIVFAGVALAVVSLTGAPSVGASVADNIPLRTVKHTNLSESRLDASDISTNGSSTPATVKTQPQPTRMAALSPLPAQIAQGQAPNEDRLVEVHRILARKLQAQRVIAGDDICHE